MTHVRCFGVLCCIVALLTTACHRKSTDDTPAAVAETNSAPVPKVEERVAVTVTNVAAPLTNSPPREPAPVPGERLYKEALSSLRTARSKDDLSAAAKLLREAADAGNAAAEHGLGICYFGGIGVAKDPDEAIAWLKKSAAHGNADAQFKLASLYIRGDEVPLDEAKAVELLRSAADAGQAEAQYNLATLYSTGKSVPKDLNEARKWFARAAEGGHAIAQSNLGVLYANGDGVEKDMAQAIAWWKKAAEQGQPSAQFNLAQALVEGKAIEKDLVEAYKWANLAADQGDRDAAGLRAGLAREISFSEIGDALKRSREFKSQLQTRWEEEKAKLF